MNSNLNTWDLYVFGDGNAVGDILENISLFINPTSGNTGFRALIATMAVTGLFVSVLQAMLNPAQGFIRVMMLIGTYLIVSLTTFSMRLNVNVIDSINTGNARVVQDVPFSVGIMPVVISKVGYYLTESLETFLQIPGDNSRAFSLTRGTSRGHFNLFGKLVADLDKLRINDPSLKKSYSQYIADCAIPGMALGKLSLTEMQASKNLLTTLEKAATPALLTRYFYSSTTTGGSGPNSDVVSCRDAMNNLKTELNDYGNNLRDASAAQLDNTGIRVDQEIAYNALFKSLITGNNAAGGTNGSTSTSTLMLQKAMVSSTSDAFRKAAAQTGNNELLQAARLSEAELNQRSAWVLGAETFKNMMGYVYIVLQCFIFAMVPLILIALMIPGLGRSILVNYVQIMLWMALWLPGLAVVNYLINLFGRGEMSQAANNSGSPPGINIYNHMALSEAGNNLVVAAQFLGTMVPTITWGLVKGAMAFQEFISAGVGSSFASSAANGLASGSLSYGNLSANTGKMNDFNTSTSVSTGQGPVNYNRTPVASNENFQAGGEKAASNSGGSYGREETMKFDRQVAGRAENSKSENQAAAEVQAAQAQVNLTKSANEGETHTKGDGTNQSINQGESLSNGKSFGESASERRAASRAEDSRKSENASENLAMEGQVGTQGKFAPGKNDGNGGKGGPGSALSGGDSSLIKSGGNANIGSGASLGGTETTAQSVSQSNTRDHSGSLDLTAGRNQSLTNSSGFSQGANLKADNSYAHGRGVQGSDGVSASRGVNTQDGVSAGFTASKSASIVTSVSSSAMAVDYIPKDDLRIREGAEGAAARLQAFEAFYQPLMTHGQQVSSQVQERLERATDATNNAFQQTEKTFNKLYEQGGTPAALPGVNGFNEMMKDHSSNVGTFGNAFQKQDSSIRGIYGALDNKAKYEVDAFLKESQELGLAKPGEIGPRDVNGDLTGSAPEADNGKVYGAALVGTAVSTLAGVAEAGLFARGMGNAVGTGLRAAAAAGTEAAAWLGATTTSVIAPVGLVVGGTLAAWEVGERTGLLKQVDEEKGMELFKKGEIFEAGRYLSATTYGYELYKTYASDFFKRGLNAENTSN